MTYSDIKTMHTENGKVYYVEETMAGETDVVDFSTMDEAREYVLFIQKAIKEGAALAV